MLWFNQYSLVLRDKMHRLSSKCLKVLSKIKFKLLKQIIKATRLLESGCRPWIIRKLGHWSRIMVTKASIQINSSNCRILYRKTKIWSSINMKVWVILKTKWKVIKKINRSKSRSLSLFWPKIFLCRALLTVQPGPISKWANSIW